MEPLLDEVLEVGIDYITATSHQRDSASPLLAFGHWLVSEEVSGGCKNRTFRASGYRGQQSGRAAFGLSRQGVIVKASAEVARDNWPQLYQFSDNVTRLDVQVTSRPMRGVTATLQAHHKEARCAARRRGRTATFKCFYGPSGPESLTLGRRCSDRYGRVYDKGLESGRQEYSGAVRYEVELHREVAKTTCAVLDSQEHDQFVMAALVDKFMFDRGLHCGFFSKSSPGIADVARRAFVHGLLVRPGSQIAPEVSRVLTWLRVCVSPSVARLCASGLEREVLDALGLCGAGLSNVGLCESVPPDFEITGEM